MESSEVPSLSAVDKIFSVTCFAYRKTKKEIKFICGAEERKNGSVMRNKHMTSGTSEVKLQILLVHAWRERVFQTMGPL